MNIKPSRLRAFLRKFVLEVNKQDIEKPRDILQVSTPISVKIYSHYRMLLKIEELDIIYKSCVCNTSFNKLKEKNYFLFTNIHFLLFHCSIKVRYY